MAQAQQILTPVTLPCGRIVPNRLVKVCIGCQGAIDLIIWWLGQHRSSCAGLYWSLSMHRSLVQVVLVVNRKGIANL